MVAIPPLDFNIQVPRPDLSSYAQRAQTMQNLQQSFGQFSQSIGQVLQAQIQAENQRRAQAQFQRDMANWRADPTTDNYVNMLIRNPWAKDQAEAAFKATEEGERKSILSYALPAYSALSAGDPVAAGDLLRRQRDALMNAGQTDKAKVLDDLVKDVEMQPSIARGNLQMLVARGVGPEKALEFIQGIEKLPSQTTQERAKAGQEIAKERADRMTADTWMDNYQRTHNVNKMTAQAAWLNATTNAARLGQDQKEYADAMLEKIAKADEDSPVKFADMNAGVQTRIGEIDAKAVAADIEANQFELLADQYESENIEGYGVFTDFNEFLKESFGLQDTVSLRRMQNEMAGVVAAYQTLSGKGPVSDFELRTFMKGIPAKNASKEIVVAYLRGRAKAARLSSMTNDLHHRFLLETSGSGRAGKQGFVLDGLLVEPGDTFNMFKQKNAQIILDQLFPVEQADQSYAD